MSGEELERRILVVDSSPTTLLSASLSLGKLTSAAIDEAADAEAAARKVANTHYSLVIMDQHGLGMSDGEAISLARK